MSSKDFKFSKLNNLLDIDFNPENFNRNELENFSRQDFENCVQIKQNVLTVFSSSIKEYFERIKLERKISDLKEEQKSVSHKLTELREKLQTMKEEKENEDSNKNIHIVRMYEQNLALRIEVLSDNEREKAVSFDFHHINESNPQETCSFVLTLIHGKKYKAGECRPSITGMEELISTLNKTNDLHRFIVNIRKKFQESFAKTSLN